MSFDQHGAVKRFSRREGTTAYGTAAAGVGCVGREGCCCGCVPPHHSLMSPSVGNPETAQRRHTGRRLGGSCSVRKKDPEFSTFPVMNCHSSSVQSQGSPSKF